MGTRRTLTGAWIETSETYASLLVQVVAPARVRRINYGVVYLAMLNSGGDLILKMGLNGSLLIVFY